MTFYCTGRFLRFHTLEGASQACRWIGRKSYRSPPYRSSSIFARRNLLPMRIDFHLKGFFSCRWISYRWDEFSGRADLLPIMIDFLLKRISSYRWISYRWDELSGRADLLPMGIDFHLKKIFLLPMDLLPMGRISRMGGSPTDNDCFPQRDLQSVGIFPTDRSGIPGAPDLLPMTIDFSRRESQGGGSYRSG